MALLAVGLRDLADIWLCTLEAQGRNVSTLDAHRQTLDRYVLPVLGASNRRDLRAGDLDELHTPLFKSGGVRGRLSSMTTVHHVHVQLGKLPHGAKRKGLLVRNVARLADTPSMAAARDRAPDMTVWAPDELRRLLDFAEDYRTGPVVAPGSDDGHAPTGLSTA